jgi:putative acetyltransferase
MPLDFTVEDPRSRDVQALLSSHLAFTESVTPPEGVFALDVAGLLDVSVTVLGARQDGRLVGIGAIKMLPAGRAELKSMHTLKAVREQGIGRSLVERLIAEARTRGSSMILVETGAMEAFAPARALYRRCGFAPCDRFGDYVDSASSVCMALDLTDVARGPE